jgi:DNA-directed RNA polymerase specialized sigma24 family protein
MTPDEELFREWQQGAVGALEALVRRHHAPLLAHLVRLTGNPALAEDLYDKLSTLASRAAALARY